MILCLHTLKRKKSKLKNSKTLKAIWNNKYINKGKVSMNKVIISNVSFSVMQKLLIKIISEILN